MDVSSTKYIIFTLNMGHRYVFFKSRGTLPVLTLLRDPIVSVHIHTVCVGRHQADLQPSPVGLSVVPSECCPLSPQPPPCYVTWHHESPCRENTEVQCIQDSRASDR